MKKTFNGLLLLLIITAAIVTACNNPAGPENNEGSTHAKEDYPVDITKGATLWSSDAAAAGNTDNSVAITYPAGINDGGSASAWGINLYTGDAAGMDLSGYGSIEIVWSAVYPDGTPEKDGEGNPNKQIIVNILCGGLDPNNDKKLAIYPGVETETTASLSLAITGDFTAGAKKDVQQIVFQAKISGTVLTIKSITFKPLKTSSNQFKGSEVFWISSDYTGAEKGKSWQGKTDTLKLPFVSEKEWAAVRVDLSNFAEKNVTVKVSLNIWMDQASKIMWQVNDSGYSVISGGNDSYETNKWVSFTGEKTITLPPVTKDGEGKVTGLPWFYLDNAGLKDGATYYIADFVLDILE